MEKIIILVILILLIASGAFLFMFLTGDNFKNSDNLNNPDKTNKQESGFEDSGTSAASGEERSLSTSPGSGGAGEGSSGVGSSGSGGGLETNIVNLPSDIEQVNCGFYFGQYGVCTGVCSTGTCVSEGRSCYCKK